MPIGITITAHDTTNCLFFSVHDSQFLWKLAIHHGVGIITN